MCVCVCVCCAVTYGLCVGVVAHGLSVGIVAHGLSVGVVGPEVEAHGADDPQLGGHLLHAADASLLLRVSKLHHQTG